MNRKEFLKIFAFGGMSLLTTSVFGKSINYRISKLKKNIGFNHIPNLKEELNNIIIHKANTRNKADFGWLKVNHTFSFANYYNPDRMSFGAIRVLNDDIISGGKGFSTHPHDNMEIITIPLDGALKHEDNMGNHGVIRKNEIQVMSAGTGITHSEFNANNTKEAKVLQIWLYPDKKNVKPRYQQMSLNTDKKLNQLYQILSPNKHDQGVWIHQNAWFSLGHFNTKNKIKYRLNDNTNGVYIFILEGDVEIQGNKLNKRDGIGIWNVNEIELSTAKNSELLLMEIPMNSKIQ